MFIAQVLEDPEQPQSVFSGDLVLSFFGYFLFAFLLERRINPSNPVNPVKKI
jgi:hypothetical protein